MSNPIYSGFIPGPGGALHLTVFTPPTGVAANRWVLHAPAFAEEMNKCRPMVSRQARALAADGAVVVVPDLSGTGDSAGEFCDADWPRWVTDIRAVHQWCLGQGAGSVLLWGVRLGCLLAIESLAELPDDSVSGLLLWQPVLSGAVHLNQFLRLRTAASMMQGASESVADLRAQLDGGQVLEVAGYALSPDLYGSVAHAATDKLPLPPGCPLAVLEVVAEAGKALLPVTAKQVDAWSIEHPDCSAATVQGSPFWMTQEIGFANALLVEGCRFVDRLPATSTAAFNPAALTHYTQDAQVVEGLVFDCAGSELVGQLHRPRANESQGAYSDAGVIIVVGGPQYRVGSHRQFQQLASALADAGVPVLRFDYRGMGDSGGELAGFTGIGEDIRSAVDTLQRDCPDVKRIVLWGLCDAATAGVFYAGKDSRVTGLVLANPWVYSERGEAQAFLKHYYLRRLFSGDLWRKLLRGNFDIPGSAASLWSFVRNALGARGDAGSDLDTRPDEEHEDLVGGFTAGLERFSGDVLLITSGNDLTAAQFTDAVASNVSLRNRLEAPGVQSLVLPEADHTFSRAAWKQRVEETTVEFVRGR